MKSRKMACECESCSVVSDSVTTWNSPGQKAGVGSHSLLQGIFPIQGSNPGLPHCRQILCQLSHKGSPRILKWTAYPLSSGSWQPRNQTGVSCIAGGFFTNECIRGSPDNVYILSNSFFSLPSKMDQPGAHSLRVPSSDDESSCPSCSTGVFINSSQDCWSLHALDLDGAPQAQAPEFFWNLLSTIFRHINFHQRNSGPSVFVVQLF